MVAGPGWAFLHPSRGTCVSGCRSYGWCHCGCGRRPKRSGVTYALGGRIKGRPYVFVSGHQARVLHPRAGAWSSRGVPVERVRPLLFWLRDQHGSMRIVALLLRMPEATIHGYAYNQKRKRVPPHAAHAIVQLVLLHRRTRSSLATWEEVPGLRAPREVTPG
jgi:hypothetical protein